VPARRRTVSYALLVGSVRLLTRQTLPQSLPPNVTMAPTVHQGALYNSTAQQVRAYTIVSFNYYRLGFILPLHFTTSKQLDHMCI